MTVLIGIAVKGRAVAGVIYQPYYNYKGGPDAKLGRCIWGIIGTGWNIVFIANPKIQSNVCWWVRGKMHMSPFLCFGKNDFKILFQIIESSINLLSLMLYITIFTFYLAVFALHTNYIF